MGAKELDEIYYELQGINAILWLFSCIGEDIDVKYIAVVACHYHDQMESILKDIAKHL